MNTPICDFVRNYAAKAPLRLHMPGHKGAGPLGVEALDITEISGADVLYAPDGIIAESEANASALFGSARTLYSVEGSSLCIRAMLYLALLWAKKHGRAPLVLAGRNAHKTFLSAVALLDIDVEWLFSGDMEAGRLSCAIDAETLERALSTAREKPAAVYITSPDYLGACADVAALARVCHAHGALLLVDNAHGAYLRFLRPSRHPLDLGADLCCDSAHKTLPVLTGGAYLHVARFAPPMLCGAADRAMALFASTSPSYLLLQSLDAANVYLERMIFDRLLVFSTNYESFINDLRADGWEIVGSEPLKLTLRPKSRGYTGSEIAGRLAESGIFCEFFDPDYIVFMFSPDTAKEIFDRLIDILRGFPARAPIHEGPPAVCRPERRLSPRAAALAPFETVSAAKALGRVLAMPTIGCPPAVPVLVCGEQIDESAVHAFRYYGIQYVDVVL